jgi:hypothetical protein
MKEIKFKSGRGGSRKGSGRPKGSTIDPSLKRVGLTGFRLPRWIVEWLKSQKGSGGRIIEDALIKQYKLRQPAIKPIQKP